MEPIGSFLALVLVFLLVAVPIIAIVAFVRASKVEKSVGQIPHLIGRVYDLEQRLSSLDGRFAALRAVGEGDVPRPRSPAGLAAAELTRAFEQTPAAATPPGPQVTSAAPPPRSPQTPVPATNDITPATAEVTAPPSPVTPSRPPAPPSSPEIASLPMFARPPGASESDVESTIAGRWFNYVGILAISLAVAFFLEYAFDNNWIGPVGRVTIGLIVGGAMYPLSQWVFHRGYQYYSEGIAGLGAAILYLSVWAGWHYYQIFPQSYAFPLMIAITALTAAVAVGRNSERIAVLALVGGLLTPILVSTGKNEEVALFSYLATLGGGMLGIAWTRQWRSVAPIQFVGTVLYFWSWHADFYARSELGVTVFFATVFFGLFAALPALRSTREGELPGVDIWIVLTNAFQYLVALRLMLWPEYRWGLTFAILALASAHLLAERALPHKETRANELARMLYAGLALTFATLAIPIRLEGKWITIAFAVEGALLIWSGLRIRSLALRVAGFALFAVVGVRLGILVFSAPTPVTFLLNERFLTLALCAACSLTAFFFAQQSDCELDATETQLFYALEIAANICFLAALSMDVWDLFGRMPSLGIDREHAQQLALSVLWIGYALALLIAGMIRQSASVRWQGLALLWVAIAKVFFFDLSFLTRFYRIISFFALGLVLLLVSFFYQKRSKMGPNLNQP
jgi:uncharacterized membrane protein